MGCEKYLKGEEKILGTATINGQNYKESIVWAWNFIMRLSPEKLVIKGEFETKTAINELTYKNIYAMKSKNVIILLSIAFFDDNHKFHKLYRMYNLNVA